MEISNNTTFYQNKTIASSTSPNAFMIQVMNLISGIGYTYITTSVCVIGFFLNLICLAVFFQLRKSATIYKYFLAKTLAESIVLLIGAFVQYGNCVKCSSYQTIGAQIYKMYFLGFLNNIAYTYSGFSEIIITIDRVLTLRNKHASCWSYKIIIPAFSCFSFVIFIPILFANYIKYLPNNEYSFVNTEFGASISYTYYLAVFILTRNSAFFIVLFGANVVLLIDYKSYLMRKNNLVSVRTETRKIETRVAENNNSSGDLINSNTNGQSNIHVVQPNSSNSSKRKITKMVIILSFVFVVSRLVQAVTTISSNVDKFNQVKFNGFTTIFGFFTNLLNYSVYSVNIFFHVYFNKSFLNCLKDMLKRGKINF